MCNKRMSNLLCMTTLLPISLTSRCPIQPPRRPLLRIVLKISGRWIILTESTLDITANLERDTMFPMKTSSMELSNIRFTSVMSSPPEGVAAGEWDLYRDETGKSSKNRRLPNMWFGTTYLFSKKCIDPKRALASITRNKGEAKKKARAEGFSYMDQLFENQPCMTKPVTVMKYDMKPFLQSCVDRYVKLAGKDAKPLKHAATPFHEERIARPVASETESKGVLAPIATRYS